jgi:hypothetical protein
MLTDVCGRMLTYADVAGGLRRSELSDSMLRSSVAQLMVNLEIENL